MMGDPNSKSAVGYAHNADISNPAQKMITDHIKIETTKTSNKDLRLKKITILWAICSIFLP